MELATKAAWVLLALIHLSPASVALSPGLARKIYGLDPGGALGVLIQHRGWLFLAVFAVCVFAIFAPDARRAASLVTAISVIGFLIVYVRAGAPAGPLHKIALVDAVAVPPLALVLFTAWT